MNECATPCRPPASPLLRRRIRYQHQRNIVSAFAAQGDGGRRHRRAESEAEGAEPEGPPLPDSGYSAGVAQVQMTERRADDMEEDVFGCEDDEGATAFAEGAAAAATCGAPAVEAAEETVVGAATAEVAEELAAGAGDGDAAASRSAPGISNGGRSSWSMAAASS